MGKEVAGLNNAVELSAFLYVMNQDIKSLSPKQVYDLYADTVKEIKAYSEEKKCGEFGYSFGPD